VRGVVCSLIVLAACSPFERDLPPCSELIEVEAAMTRTSGIDRGCVQPDSCARVDYAGYLDLDLTLPGQQYDCEVIDVQHAGLANETTLLLPMCDNLAAPSQSANQPCWAVVVDVASCQSPGEHLAIEIERPAPAPPDTVVRARCTALCSYLGADPECTR